MKLQPPETSASAAPPLLPNGALSRAGDALSQVPVSCTLPQEMNQNSSATATTVASTTVTVADGLAQGLAAALQAGLTDKAAELAVELSKLRIKCDIRVLRDENEIRSHQADFTVKVHIEDRVVDRCFINLTVKASDTIGDLKKKVMILHNLPMEVQRWIIGKKIHPDQTRLHQCGVKGPGHTLYLYLVTARSVGLSKANYETQLQTIALMKQASASTAQQVSPGTENLSSSLDPARDSGVSDTLGSGIPGSSGENQHQTNVVSRPGRTGTYLSESSSSSSVSPASVRIQEMLQSHQLVQPPDQQQPGTPGTPAEAVLSHASPGLGVDPWTVSTSTTAPASAATMANTNGSSNVSEPMYWPTGLSGFPVEDDEQAEGWSCPACTYRNLPMWPGCEICNQQRPESYQVPENYKMTDRERKLVEDEQLLERLTHEQDEVDDGTRLENYQHLLAIEDLDLVPNPEPFQCAICFDDIGVGDGIVLRECLHQFCRDCLMGAVQHCENAELTCPYQDNEYSCKAALQEREIRALVPEDMFFKFLQRGLDQAECMTQNSYHCKTANCPGWCVYEDMVNFFKCEVCHKINCLTCKAIHMGQNCQQYQDGLRMLAYNDASAKQTHQMLKNLVSNGEAMHCPQCQVIVQKKGGCDWIRCSICKTEICWVTKGPRWGPNGEGDMSGGCKCRLNGKKCHPQCVNCH